MMHGQQNVKLYRMELVCWLWWL